MYINGIYFVHVYICTIAPVCTDCFIIITTNPQRHIADLVEYVCLILWHNFIALLATSLNWVHISQASYNRINHMDGPAVFEQTMVINYNKTSPQGVKFTKNNLFCHHKEHCIHILPPIGVDENHITGGLNHLRVIRGHANIVLVTSRSVQPVPNRILG